MIKLRCVNYVNKYSIDNDSFADLTIGDQHNLVGCNSGVFGASNPGDFVIITAKKNNTNELYAVIGVLESRVPNCTLWADRGGCTWRHNFKYTAKTPIFHVTEDIFNFITAACQELQVDPKYLFHSRFCGARYLPVVYQMITRLANVV
jgi:hypothetical protein